MPTKIEWCDETLNPFWGCTHGCWYCTARGIAHMRAERVGKARGYSDEVIQKMKRFEPVWLPDADRIIAQCSKWRKSKTIFWGYMGDLFCQGFKYNWMVKIHEAIINNEQHRHIFLTKAPDKMFPFFPETPSFKEPLSRCWFGYSDDGTQIGNYHWINFRGQKNRFVSFEPLIGDCININFDYVDWIIIGALTLYGKPVHAKDGGTRLEWVRPVIDAAGKRGIPILLKDNLLQLYPQLKRYKEFPW